MANSNDIIPPDSIDFWEPWTGTVPNWFEAYLANLITQEGINPKLLTEAEKLILCLAGENELEEALKVYQTNIEEVLFN